MQLQSNGHQNPTTLTMVLAPEQQSSFDDCPLPTQLQVHDHQCISALWFLTREGTTVKINQSLTSHLKNLSTDHMEFIVDHLQSLVMTKEEFALPKLTRHQLHTLLNWPVWDAACDRQLAAHYVAFLDPVPHPEKILGVCPNILQIHWTFAIKDDGTQKAWATTDGSGCAAPWLHETVKTYASCIDQLAMKLFFALAAVHNKIVIIVDTTNAYQQLPPPTKPCFLEIDESYQSSYCKKFKKEVDLNHMIPHGCTLQGHLEAGALWKKMIVEILETYFGFKSTIHEQNIYQGEIQGETVLVCCQVDDFAIALDSIKVANYIIPEIDKHVSTSNKGIGMKYNRVDVLQTCDTIKLYCESYIDKVLLYFLNI